jgi:hypothetical protein
MSHSWRQQLADSLIFKPVLNMVSVLISMRADSEGLGLQPFPFYYRRLTWTHAN